MSDTTTRKRASTRRPKVVIGETMLARIEALAEGALRRTPELADKLLEELGRARIVPDRKVPATVVTVGSRVTYRDETTGKDQSLTLVFPEQADIDRQRVSVMTPVGVALIGLSEGATFYWDTRDNQRRTLTVVRVEPPQTGGAA